MNKLTLDEMNLDESKPIDPRVRELFDVYVTRVAELYSERNAVKAEGIREMSAKFFLNGIPFTESNIDHYADKLVSDSETLENGDD